VKLRLPKIPNPFGMLAQAERDFRYVADVFNGISADLEEQNRRMLDAIIEDENRLRQWVVTLIGSDGVEHTIPVESSRKLVRKLKLAMYEVGGDAFAAEQSSRRAGSNVRPA
jgi:hypothetical protein